MAYFESSRAFAGATSARLVQGRETADVPAVDTVPGGITTQESIGGSPGSAFGWINSATDTDWFRLQTQAGQTYTIFLSGYSSAGGTPALPDPLLRVYDSGGQQIAVVDDSLTSLNPNYQYTPTASGLIYLSAGSADGQTGRFSFLVITTAATPPDLVKGDKSTTASVTIGGYADGVLETAGDADWYSVSLTAGQSYMFHLNGASASPLGDPHLRLLGSDGSMITFNDDYGDGFNSGLRYTATKTDVYYLSAEAYGSETGGYRVLAEAVAPQDPLDTIDWGAQIANPAITIYFAKAGQIFNGQTADRDWTASEMASVMAAGATFSAVSNLSFTTTTSSANATMIMVLDGDLDADTLGYMTTPPSSPAIGVFSSTNEIWSTAALQPGGAAFATLIHEMGHGLGLAHPHDTGGSSEIMEGVTDGFDSYGVANLNQGVFTMMSYNDGWWTGPAGGPTSFTYGVQATPMALDIAVLQLKYGAASNHAGDDVYVLPAATGLGVGYSALWDTGGIDTITASGASNAVIDLRAATLLNAVGGGGYVSYIAAVQGGLVVAAGVVIENAYGAGGSDILTGNAFNNRLSGGAGDDTLNGGAGNDILDGGTGSDTAAYGDLILVGITADLNGGTVTGAEGGFDTLVSIENVRATNFADIVFGDGYTNRLEGLAGADALFGGAGDDEIFGGLGVDVLYGEAGVDWLYGGSDGDTLVGGDGNDVLLGEDGADTIYGDAGNDTLVGGAGADLMFDVQGANAFFGEDGADTVIGGDQADAIYTGADNDVVFAGLGADVLVGGTGLDTLYGDGGGDLVFAEAGDDIVVGGEGQDQVYGQEGADLIFGEAGDDALVGGAGEDRLYGGGGGDIIFGEADGDILDGGAGNDSLYGQDGNDVLLGGGGQDRLEGGSGADTYHFGSMSDGTDSIFGFSEAEGDKISLQASGFGLTPGLKLNDGTTFCYGAGVTPPTAAATLYYDTGSKGLWLDADGTGGSVATLIAFLTDTPALHAADFLFV